MIDEQRVPAAAEETAQQPRPRRFGRKRMLAVAGAAGAALALGGLTACETDEPKRDTGSAQDEPADESEDGDEDTDDDASGSEEGKGEEKPVDSRELSAGDTAVWESGLKVTVSEPEAYTPGEWAMGHTEGNDAYTFTLVIANETEEDVDADMLLIRGRAGEEGVAAEEIWDSENKIGLDMLGTTVRPGKKATSTIAFGVPAGAGFIDLEIEPLFYWDAKPAFWRIDF
ncbi:hypothetical protein GCM10009716_25380 [Streptomyces sodiiphilus]|uniref:DUF4352 domain-containing protein n=1 Tax=Streptomyces sodiiphilus TaxID=226217 RepID=A0ABP5AIH3_9ACTN